MPRRIVTVFGSSFHGFRISFVAGLLGVDWPEGYNVLERTVLQELRLFATLSPERRSLIAASEPTRPPPQMEDHIGDVEAVVAEEDETDSLVIMCASFPFRFWPFGRWAVYEGGRISPNGELAIISEDELNHYW